MLNGLSSFMLFSRGARAAIVVASALLLAVPSAFAVDDAYRPPNEDGYSSGQSYPAPPPPTAETYEPYRPLDGSRRTGDQGGDAGGYGEPNRRTSQALAEDASGGKFSVEFIERHYKN